MARRCGTEELLLNFAFRVCVSYHERETYYNVSVLLCVSVAFLRRYNVTCTSYTLIFFVGENGCPRCGRENLAHHLGAFGWRHPFHRCRDIEAVRFITALTCFFSHITSKQDSLVELLVYIHAFSSFSFCAHSIRSFDVCLDAVACLCRYVDRRRREAHSWFIANVRVVCVCV